MHDFILILVILIPTSGMFLLTYLFLKKNSEKALIELQSQLKKDRQKHFLPMRVDAFQRVVLLMDRIHPGNLVMRLHNPAKPAKLLQTELLAAIREEFDHNISQQLFVSPQAWELVRNAKEETIKIINLAGSQTDATATGTDLAGKILEITAEIGELPTEIATAFLKKEMQQLF